ncbi:MAG: VWA domain-containing protein [Polyangiales bacterium]
MRDDEYGGTGGTGGSGGTCGSVDVNVERVIPNIFLIVDRSASMRWDFKGCNSSPYCWLNGGIAAYEPPSRWDALKAGLLDPSTGVLPELDSIARFALSAFDNVEGANPICPRLVTADLALDNASTIQSLLDSNPPSGGTATAQAISAVLDEVQSMTLPDGPTIFLLATDGEPTGCGDTSPTVQDFNDTIAAIDDVAAAGFPTYVIGVGIASSKLSAMAQAGRPNDPNADYFPASNSTALSNAFHDIIGAQIPCTVEVQGTVDIEKAYLGTVMLNDVALEYGNGTRGWTMLDDGVTLELLGTACDDWTTQSDASLTANFPCGVVVLE